MEESETPLAKTLARRYGRPNSSPSHLLRLTHLPLGRDLAGITYWEMRSDLASRPRRLAKYPRATEYADVNHTPMWMQWLRHTRPLPPTIDEQKMELSRQAGMKQLAARADERWKSIPSFLDKPRDTEQAQPLLQPRDNAGYGRGQTESEQHQGVMNAAKTEQEHVDVLQGKDVDKGRFKGETREPSPRDADPLKLKQRTKSTGASEGWQPAAWSPGKAQRRGE